MDPVEQVKQTLMTHMWPNMVRKTRQPDPGISLLDQEDEEVSHQSFPTTFDPARDSHLPSSGAFPTLDEITEQIKMDQDDDETFERLARLEMLEENDWDEIMPPDEEYARLDEWLEEDGPDEDLADATDEDARDEPPRSVVMADKTPPGRPPLTTTDSGFDDDFTDFQSAPTRIPSTTLDPTPLLLHLQSIRAELADLEDEDERRRRAGEEVEALMRTLGMEVGNLDAYRER